MNYHTKQAQKIYLAFFESEEEDNAKRIAKSLRQLVEEIIPGGYLRSELSGGWRNEILAIARELEEPGFLDTIYGDKE